MKARGVRLEYSFQRLDDAHAQRGAEVHNPLFDLLQAVRQNGSIQQAATAMGASYRHVWGALKRWEAELGEPLVRWSQGQPARLTPFAERLLWSETRARARLVPHIEALRAELQRVLQEAFDGDQQVLSVRGSHDLALPLLRQQAGSGHGLHIDLHFTGSMDALRALAEGRCAVAGFHVPPLANGRNLFARALKPLLKPGRHKLIGCMRRRQGLIVPAGNPAGVGSLADVGRSRYVNRQPGSGTRLLAEHLLQQQHLRPPAGFDDRVEDSHLAVAAAVASGIGDLGLGLEAAASRYGLGFVPLVEEQYFLVCLKDVLELPAVLRLRDVLASAAWPTLLASLTGYAPDRAGEVLSLTRALSWWHYRNPRGDASSPAASRR